MGEERVDIGIYAVDKTTAAATSATNSLKQVEQTATASSKTFLTTANAGKALGFVMGGFLATSAFQLAQQAAAAGADLAQLNVQATNSRKAFVMLSGGADAAQAKLLAVRRASSGTIDDMGAMEIANKAAALGMANTAGELQRAVGVAKNISSIFGGTIAGQLENLSAAAANLSFVRLDTLGISASKTKERMAELQASTKGLTQEQAFLQAALQIAEENFGKMGEGAGVAVSGVDQLAVSWRNLGIAVAESQIGTAANNTFSNLSGLINKLAGNYDYFGNALENVKFAEKSIQLSKGLNFSANMDAVKSLKASLELIDTLTKAGVPGLSQYGDQLGRMADTMAQAPESAGNYANELLSVGIMLDKVTGSTSAYQNAIMLVGQGFITQNEDAQKIVAAMVTLNGAYINGAIGAEQYRNIILQYSKDLIKVRTEVAATTNAEAAMAAATAAVREQLAALTSTADGTAVSLRNVWISAAGSLGAVAAQAGMQAQQAELGKMRTAWALGGATAEQMQFREAEFLAKNNNLIDKQEQLIKDATKAQQGYGSAVDATAQAYSGLESKIKGIPGIGGTSQVTETDMAKAKAGMKVNYPDDYVRQAKDEMLNGVDYANIDPAEVAKSLGLDLSVGFDVVIAELERQWSSGEYFVNPDNLLKVNWEAYKTLMQQEANASLGSSNLIAAAMNQGITPESWKAATEGTGPLIVEGVTASINAADMNPTAALFGTKMEGAFGDANTEAGKAAKAAGEALARTINAAFNALAGTLPWNVPLSPGGTGGTGGTGDTGGTGGTPPPSKAVGTSYWAGGAVRVHKDETIVLPRGSAVRTAAESAGAAPATTITNYVSLANNLDAEAFLYKMLASQRRRAH
jgi:hypothetical protein